MAGLPMIVYTLHSIARQAAEVSSDCWEQLLQIEFVRNVIKLHQGIMFKDRHQKVDEEEESRTMVYYL